jgi:hypothetical protein
MRPGRLFAVALAVARLTVAAPARAGEPQAREVIDHALGHDPWGMSGARVTARAVLTDKQGKKEEIAFAAQSLRVEAGLSKSLVRFMAPAELRGAGFLQVQHKDADDDRYLYLPDLGRARRISGSVRTSAFMGTDFSYADLDRRDLREGAAAFTKDETVDGRPCYGVVVTPSRKDSDYSRIELAIARDTFLPLRMKMFDRAGVLWKQFHAEQTRRVDGQWFITRSTMADEVHGHRTLLILDEVAVRNVFPDGLFSVKSLERM